MAAPWIFNLQQEPANNQVVWIRNGWQSPAVQATYLAGPKTFRLADNRQLAFAFVWRWRPV
jgi:hypothetical protein